MAARVAANARTVCVKRSRGWIGATMAPALRQRAWAAHSGLAPCCTGASTPHPALAVARAAASRHFATATQAVPAATAVPGAASRKPQSYMVVRFVDIDGNESYGTLESAKKAGSAGAGAGAESTRGYVPAELDKVYHARPIQQMGDRGHAWKTLDEQLRVARFLPPVEPVAIYCIGLNYHKHALETGLTVPKYPTMFLKPVTSVIAHRHEIVIPSVARDPPEVRRRVLVVVCACLCVFPDVPVFAHLDSPHPHAVVRSTLKVSSRSSSAEIARTCLWMRH